MFEMSEESKLLNEILRIGARGLIEPVAIEAGVAYDTVYDQCRGNVNPSIQVIKAAYIITQDPRLKRMLEPTGYELTPKDQLYLPEKPVHDEAVDVILAVSQFIEAHREAFRDGRYSAQEKVDLVNILKRVKRESGELETALMDDMNELSSNDF